MWQLYYTPVFVESDPGDPNYTPGMLVDGELVSALGRLPPRTRAPVCDRGRDPMRFLLAVPLPFPEGWSAPDDWTPVTLAEASSDYPGAL